MFSGGLSPDGTMLAINQMRGPFSAGGTLIVVSMESGDRREIHSYEKGAFMLHQMGLVAWSLDSRFLYVSLRAENRILRIPAEGGLAVDTELIREAWSDELSEYERHSLTSRALSVSPDGKQISLSFQDKQEFGLWALENFLPQLTQAE